MTFGLSRFSPAHIPSPQTGENNNSQNIRLKRNHSSGTELTTRSGAPDVAPSRRHGVLPESSCASEVGHGTVLDLRTLPHKIQVWQVNASIDLPKNAINIRIKGISPAELIQKAGDKIIKAADQGLTELNLSMIPAATLPDAIRQLQSLEKLSVADTAVTEFPAAILALRNLQSLVLSHNHRLTDLPVGLSQLPNLRELIAVAMPMRSLPSDIGGLTQLETLKLDGAQCDSVPEGSTNLRALHTLEITNGDKLQSKRLVPHPRLAPMHAQCASHAMCNL